MATFTTGFMEHDDSHYRLFVANVPSQSTAYQLGEHFAKDYKITHVELRRPRRFARGAIARTTYGFLSFATEADRDAALEGINGAEFDGNLLRAENSHTSAERTRRRQERDQERRDGSRSRSGSGRDDDGYRSRSPRREDPLRAFVGSLPGFLTQEQFQADFGQAGTADLITNRAGYTFGYGFVQFDDRETRDAFVQEWRGKLYRGHNIQVEVAFERRPRPQPRRRRRHRSQDVDDRTLAPAD